MSALEATGYVLVRVSVALLKELMSDTGSGPVVIVGVEEAGDGTYEMNVRTPELTEAVAGQGMEVTSYVVHHNGTRQLTIKPRRRAA